MIRHHTTGCIGVYRGGWWASSPNARKAGNGFMDWDKVIVLDGSASQPFHAKAIREPSRSLRRTPDGIRYIFIDFTTNSPEHPPNGLTSASAKT